jgi:hypothetical protein
MRYLTLEISLMKTTTTLLIALGLVSSAVLAQAQSSPGAGGVQTDSRAGDQSQYSIGSGTGASPALQSGASSGSGRLDTQSGPQSGMPPHPSSGTSGTQSGMPPPASPDTSGAQPGMPPSSTSGASGTMPGSQSGMPPSSPPDTSGAQPGMPPHPASGTSGKQSEAQPQPSSGTSGMQSPAQSRAGGESPIARLQPKTENGVTYVCGGVGKEEATYMRREAKKHDMLLTFAGKDGEFLADVNVAIKDANGNAVLETTCDGPMMLVDLPKGGKYHVHAVANGYAVDQTVSVAKGPGKRKAEQVATVFLTWPTQVAQIDPTEATTATGASGTSGTSRTGGGSRDEKKHRSAKP